MLDCAEPLRHASFTKRCSGLPCCGQPGRCGSQGPRRSATARLEVPRPAAHLRKLVRRRGPPNVRGRAVHGACHATHTGNVYAHLLNTDDHAKAMAALDAMANTRNGRAASNVVPLAR